MNKIYDNLTNNGFADATLLFEPAIIEKLLDALVVAGAFDYDKHLDIPLLSLSEVNVIAHFEQLLSLIKRYSGETMFPVKAFILDKTAESNWEIPWHQDLKIAVNQQLKVPEYINWSIEAGIPHVQPPVEVMEKLITLRIHLDPCDVGNAIHISPGSHKDGILTMHQIQALLKNIKPVIYTAAKDSIMLMKPLVLHYSPASSSVHPRRILQIEFGYDLDNGITWHGLD
ncbi:hypothetical protein J7E50_02535 [Pedobacter sp. ISL-68]|uniref:hypothetical protein n=1 Tax=unclassified Pedobacter TaxID=2628915 RepID=UPI001BEBF3AA|nr:MULTISPECIES: hypothetical protein [unclassified Pedobacter]MBT2560098.1 hypothetical protein [Pedobacter sp. ISL-64]MBT2589077.1 hypothetical protein [Pedobacter sp. ISL-68]